MKTRYELEAEIAELSYTIAREERIAGDMRNISYNHYSYAVDGCESRIAIMQEKAAELKSQYDNTLPDPHEEVEFVVTPIEEIEL